MKKMRRILALSLAFILIFSTFSLVGATDATADNGGVGRIIDGYDPIPLLIIKINFDADGDGMNNYLDDSMALKHKDKNAPQYGEQWCYSEDSFWYDICFGDEHYNLNSYYKYISNNRFWWIPVEETCGTHNDSVVTVTLSGVPHPSRAEAGNSEGGLGSGNERRLAIEAADEYVDFSKYDKDGSGDIDFTEMTIMYIYGGYEIAYAGTSSYKYAFPTHAHVSQFTATGLKCDGVGVYAESQPYVRMGERGSSNWSTYGTVAHELGHVLGAKDLYTDAKSWIGGCGNLSLMGSGSKGKAGGTGGTGTSPTVLDPYYSILYGFADETVAKSGTNVYTLYSHESTVSEYNVIRINLPNPNEYLLIENRSHSETGYDNNGLNAGGIDGAGTDSMQGILIWHIDEGIINKYARPNNGDGGHAAGFTVITPNNNVQDMNKGSTWSSESVSSVFIASNDATYTFPVSNRDENPGTWYTSLTAEQAADCNIKIEFLTAPGNEMQVRISGAYDLPVEVAAGAYDTTQNTMTIKASVYDFNGAVVTGCKIYLADNSSMTNAQVQEFTNENAGSFSAQFTGLTPDKEYYYKVEMETTHGVSATKVSSKYTSSVPVEKTQAKITLIVNSDLYKTPVTIKVKVGDTLKVTFPMTKKGYTFEGWYLDEACTQKYELVPLATADDFTLYAKWVVDAAQSTTTTAPQTPDVSTDPVTPDPQPTEEFPVVVVIIIVAAVIVIGGAAGVFIINKKKTN